MTITPAVFVCNGLAAETYETHLHTYLMTRRGGQLDPDTRQSFHSHLHLPPPRGNSVQSSADCQGEGQAELSLGFCAMTMHARTTLPVANHLNNLPAHRKRANEVTPICRSAPSCREIKSESPWKTSGVISDIVMLSYWNPASTSCLV